MIQLGLYSDDGSINPNLPPDILKIHVKGENANIVIF